VNCVQQLGLDMIGGHSCVNDIQTSSFQGLKSFPSINKLVQNVDLFSVMLSNPFHTSSVLVRRDNIVRFPELGYLSEDFALWIKLLSLNWVCARHLMPLSTMFKHAYTDSGLSSKLSRMEIGELNAICSIVAVHPFKVLIASMFSCIKFGARFVVKFYRNL